MRPRAPRARGGRGRPRDRRGFILPLVLLATLAITALAVAAFTLAQAEHRATEWERSWIGAVAGGGAAGSGAPPAATLAAIGSGYHLIAVGGAVSSPLRRHEIWWCLDPRAEASGPWAPGEHPPRMGPLDPARVLDLLGVEAPTEAGTEVVLVEAEIPGEPDVRLVAASAGRLAVIRAAEGIVLVVAEGSIRLAGSGTVRGVLLVAGGLAWPEEVRIAGGARAGTIHPPASAAGSDDIDTGWAARVAALGVLPACPEMVHTVGRLGYF